MYSIDVGVDISDKFCYPGQFSKQLHGFMLASIEKINPSLSEYLHDSKERSYYSIHLIDGHNLRISTTSKEIVAAIQKSFLISSSIETPSVSTRISTIKVKEKDIEDGIEIVDKSIFRLNFRTPTAFAQSGNYYILPEAKRLFSSALKTYHLLGYEVEWEEIERLIDKLIMVDVKISTKVVHFDKFNVRGFVGYVDWSTKQLTHQQKQRLAHLIMCLDTFGAGIKTAWGMGRVQATTPRIVKSSGGARK